MIITVKTFNGHTINDGTDYEARGLNLSMQPGSRPSFLDGSRADSRYTGAWSREVRSLAVSIKVKDYADRRALMEQLRGWFQPGTEGDLVVSLDADGEDYQASCVVQSFQQDPTYLDHFLAILQTGQSSWISVDRDTEDWEVTGAALEKTVHVEGSEGVETQLNMEILPTVAPGSGYFYQRLLRLVGTSVNYGIRPWCLELDTAALVTAGKLRSDCHDLRIFVRDAEARRWIADPNTDHTKIWFNAPLGPSYSLTLLTELDDETNPGILEFVVSAASKVAIDAMPFQGIVYHGTEWISYIGKNSNTGTLFIDQRGMLGTALQAHLANDVFQTIQNPIFLYYGNPAATDPADDDPQYDETRPVFNLADSDNSQWVWGGDYPFADPDHPSRPGQWSPYMQPMGPNSHLYYYEKDAGTGDAAAGMKIGTYIGSNGKTWPVNSVMTHWTFYSPGGIASVDLAGQRVCQDAGWPDWNGFMRSNDGVNYPGSWASWITSVLAWTAWTISGSAADSPYIRLVMFGGQVGVSVNGGLGFAALEMNTAEVTFTSTNLPSASLLAETDNYPLSIGIRNNTTGDQINLLFPMILGAPILLDSEAKTALYQGSNVHGSILLNDESRPIWIRLLPGDNDLEVISADIGTIDITLSWNRRRI